MNGSAEENRRFPGPESGSPPRHHPEARKLRVAAYCRVSSDSLDQLNSFAAQNAYYTALIGGNPDWELVDIYADRGITGTSVDKRDDFQRLLSDCRRGLIDKVLVKSVSRFARTSKDFLEATRELKSSGVGRTSTAPWSPVRCWPPSSPPWHKRKANLFPRICG